MVDASGGNPAAAHLRAGPVGSTADDQHVLALVAPRVRATRATRLACFAMHGRPAPDERSPRSSWSWCSSASSCATTTATGTVRHDTFGQAAVLLLSPQERFAVCTACSPNARATDGEKARHYLHAGQAGRGARAHALRAAEIATSRNERADHLAIATHARQRRRGYRPRARHGRSARARRPGRRGPGVRAARGAEDRVCRRCDGTRRSPGARGGRAQHELVWPALEAAVEAPDAGRRRSRSHRAPAPRPLPRPGQVGRGGRAHRGAPGSRARRARRASRSPRRTARSERHHWSTRIPNVGAVARQVDQRPHATKASPPSRSRAPTASSSPSCRRANRRRALRWHRR